MRMISFILFLIVYLCKMVFYGIVVINHMAVVVVAEKAMWCVTLVPVFYLACRDFSDATRLIRDRLTPPSSFLPFSIRRLCPKSKELATTISKPQRKPRRCLPNATEFIRNLLLLAGCLREGAVVARIVPNLLQVRRNSEWTPNNNRPGLQVVVLFDLYFFFEFNNASAC